MVKFAFGGYSHLTKTGDLLAGSAHLLLCSTHPFAVFLGLMNVACQVYIASIVLEASRAGLLEEDSNRKLSEPDCGYDVMIAGKCPGQPDVHTSTYNFTIFVAISLIVFIVLPDFIGGLVLVRRHISVQETFCGVVLVALAGLCVAAGIMHTGNTTTTETEIILNILSIQFMVGLDENFMVVYQRLFPAFIGEAVAAIEREEKMPDQEMPQVEITRSPSVTSDEI